MDLAVKRRKKVCPHCGRRLWLREFRKLKNGTLQGWCKQCMAAYKRESYARNKKKEDGIFFSAKWQRVVVKRGYSTRFHWNENELSLLRRHFPNTPTIEVAQMLGVSPRTVERIAYRMGLKKDKEYILSNKRDKLMIANVTNSKMIKHRERLQT